MEKSAAKHGKENISSHTDTLPQNRTTTTTHPFSSPSSLPTGLTDRDEEITRADQPERFALRRGPAPPGFDPLECAQWIWSRLLPADPETAGFPSPATLQLQKGCREVEGDQRDPRSESGCGGESGFFIISGIFLSCIVCILFTLIVF